MILAFVLLTQYLSVSMYWYSTVLVTTCGSPKVTRLFQYLKMRIKYKFFKIKFVNFQRFAIFMQNFIELSLVTLRYRNDNMTKFKCRSRIPYIFAGGDKFWIRIFDKFIKQCSFLLPFGTVRVLSRVSTKFK